MVETLIELLRSHAPVPDKDAILISKHIHTRTVKEGEVLLQQGKIARELFFISEGVLKILTINDKGNEVTLFFLKENQFCTILNSFNNNIPAHESIAAACQAELVVFPKEQLLQLYELIPYFKELIDNITRQGLLYKIQIRNSYSGEDASARYQKFLLQQPEIALRVSLNDIASYLGITPQSLSRIRRNMR